MKKCVIFSVRLSVIIIMCLTTIAIVVFSSFVVSNTHSANSYIFTIAIDAGHGGRDVGCSGVTTSVNESDINLSIALKLRQLLKDYGFNVVLTRSNKDGLYDSNATNFKLSDMNKRVEIIKKAKPDILISIHQNSFEDGSLHGAQVFYQENDKKGMMLASVMQEQLKNTLGNVRGESNSSDLYLLKESGVLGVLIECGYLTNAEDENRLISDGYQLEIAYAILSGVIRYLVVVGSVTY